MDVFIRRRPVNEVVINDFGFGFCSVVGLRRRFLAHARRCRGQITSQEEGPMEGVVVSAKGAGTNITISVVSDSKAFTKQLSARTPLGRTNIP